MSVDYAKKERAFLDALKEDTGHTLEEWLALIDAELLEERNDIIDWLRQHGFTFSRASWIERIHHNGGEPIYADTASSLPTPSDEPPTRAKSTFESSKSDPLESEVRTPSPAPNQEEKQTAEQPAPQLQVVATKPIATNSPRKTSDDSDDIEQTLARAKGLRPLAQHLVAEVKSVVPDVTISALKSALVFANGKTTFGLLVLSAKDLRLGLALSPNSPEKPFEPPQFAASHARISENMTHMLVLDDVRQITPSVLTGVQNAATRA